MTEIEVVIFDMGGVLLRTEDYAPRLALCQRFGLSPEELDRMVFSSESSALAEIGEIDEQQHWMWVGQQLRLDPSAMAEFVEAWWSGDRIDLELVETIRLLRQRYKTALLSNAWSGARAGVQQKHNFLDVFDLVVFSAEIRRRKPAVEAFQYVLDYFNVQPAQAVFVDDFERNIEAAMALGLKTVRFRSPAQALDELAGLLGHPIS